MSRLEGEAPARKYLNRAAEGIFKSFEGVTDTRIQKVLSGIELASVSRIVNRELTRSRVAREDSITPFDFKSVEIQSDDVRLSRGVIKGPAGFEFATGRILFDPEKFHRLADEVLASVASDEREKLFPSLVMLAFFHEVAHKASTVLRVSGSEGDTIESSTGLHHRVVKLDKMGQHIGGGQNDYEILNEAVTNHLGIELTLEYVKDISVPDVNPNTLERVDTLLHNIGSGSSIRHEMFVNFLSLLARKSGLPEIVVWQGFKEAYFNNRNMHSLERDMAELTGINFNEELKFESLLAVLGSVKIK